MYLARYDHFGDMSHILSFYYCIILNAKEFHFLE